MIVLAISARATLSVEFKANPISNVLKVALPVAQSSILPSALLRRYMEKNFPTEQSFSNDEDTDDDIEPIQAGAPNKPSTPSNPVTPCTPIPGKTAIVIGQDYYSITNYTSSFLGHPSPIGYMGYTALKNDWGELTGLKKRIDYGGGVQWVDGLAKMYPSSSIQLGLWIVGQCEDIVVGVLDHNIQRLAKYIKDHGKHHAFFLRIGYEFDSEENHYDAGFYRVAFQRIVNIFREVNTTNVAFVWHASGFGARNKMHISEWYPGARYVDWCGVSLFQQPYSCSGTNAFCRMQSVEEVLEFCKLHNIPSMIAESTPYGGLVDEHTMMKNPEAHNRAGIVGDSWSKWFEPVISLIERYDIRMWSYINCNWDLQRMWQVNHAPNEHWGDTRIEGTYFFKIIVFLYEHTLFVFVSTIFFSYLFFISAYSGIRKKWLEYVLHAPRFQMFTSPLAPPATRNPTFAPTILSTIAGDTSVEDSNSNEKKKAEKEADAKLRQQPQTASLSPPSLLRQRQLQVSDSEESTVVPPEETYPVDEVTNAENNAENPVENGTSVEPQDTFTPTLSPSMHPSTHVPSTSPTFYPTAPNYAPLGHLHADVCSPPRTQVLLAKHPDYTDDEYGERTHDSDKNHSLPLPPGGGSIPHHRRDFYTANERIILRNMLEIIVFFLEILEIFLAIMFFLAVLVLSLSCMYKYCSRSIDRYQEQHQSTFKTYGKENNISVNINNANNRGYQSLSQQEEITQQATHSSKKTHDNSRGEGYIAMTRTNVVDRKGYVVLE